MDEHQIRTGGVVEGSKVARGQGGGGGEQGRRITAEDEQMRPLPSSQWRWIRARNRAIWSSARPPHRGWRAPGHAKWSSMRPPRSSVRPSSSSTTALSSTAARGALLQFHRVLLMVAARAHTDDGRERGRAHNGSSRGWRGRLAQQAGWRRQSEEQTHEWGGERADSHSSLAQAWPRGDGRIGRSLEENRTNWAFVNLAKRPTREPNRPSLYYGSLTRGLPNRLYISSTEISLNLIYMAC
jgi:hypothetical protein